MRRHALCLFFALGGSLLAAAAGCHSDDGFFRVDCLADIPPGAVPLPTGTYAAQWEAVQANLAEQDKFVIYGYEWDVGAEPTQFGKDHLEQISDNLPHAPFPVVVARSGDEALDAVRRQRVVAFLAAQGHDSADDLVVVGRPEALGLYGFEAPTVARGFVGGTAGRGGGQNLMQQQNTLFGGGSRGLSGAGLGGGGFF